MENEILRCQHCEAVGVNGKTFKNKVALRSHERHCKKKQEQSPVIEETQKETLAPSPRERAKRVPFGVPQRKLKPPEDGSVKYHYRYFNDNWAKEPGRVLRAQQAGYEIVDNQEKVPVGTNDDGSSIKGVLMRIPQEMYEEDQRLKQTEVDKVDQAIKGGSFEAQPGDRRYTPEGIKMWSSNKPES